MKSKKIKAAKEFLSECIRTTEQYIVCLYLFGMLGIFPLYYKEQYYKIGDAKFQFFRNITLGFTGMMCALILLQHIVKECPEKTKRSGHFFLDFLETLSTLDYAVFLYAICVVLSFLFSDFKDFALKGAAGWEMGLCSQLLFVALYFILSRQKEWLSSILLTAHLASSFLVFILGFLHRFDVDPLGMYTGLELAQKKEFLSTIGQATWFSSYVCTVFSIGVVLFYVSKKRWIRILTGGYSIAAFAILVTQNSDSAYIAIAGILLLLGYFSLRDTEALCRYWQLMCLLWGTFAGVGILQRVFEERMIPLDGLSLFFSQGAVSWIGLGISAVMLWYGRKSKTMSAQKREERLEKIRRIYWVCLCLFAAAVILLLVFVILNTTGCLYQWFGYQSTNSYLLFDAHWGSNRGSTWMVCWQEFWNLPWFQKLFGVGPDSVSAYLYSRPDTAEYLQHLWGSVRLTNAHNEYLNSLLCYGIVGVVSWVAVLAAGIFSFCHKAEEQPFLIAFACCIVGYACHNIFCYQQVCCTPFLFLALGVGESLTKSEKFNNIK